MSTTSADPIKLERFVSGVKTAREVAETDQSSIASLSRTTIAACDGYVSVPALGALATLLDAMGENETFVSTVRTELLAADVHDNGTYTISDSRLLAALAASGVGTPPAPVIFDPISIVGIPQTSGFVDDPICAANGNMVHQDLDLGFPGYASALTIERTYNSVRHDVAGAFGAGWSSILDVSLDVSMRSGSPVADQITAHLADGASVVFTGAPAGATPGWRHDSRRVHALEELEGSSGYLLHLDRERRYRFDRDGLLTGWDHGPAVVDVERREPRIVALTERRSGRRLTIELDTESFDAAVVMAVLSSDGRRVDYRRDGQGRLVVRETPAGEQRYEWDGGLLLSVVDADGVRPFVNVYDGIGRVMQQTSPFGRVTSYRYEFPGATVITDERNVRQAMVHDGRGNLTAVIDVDGSAMRITYDDADRAVRVVAKSGAEWRYDFDTDTGDLLRRHDPDGLSQAWTWDHLGRVLTDTDRTGATTSFEYADEHRTPVRIVGPDGSVATAELDEAGQPVTVTDPDGIERSLRWDRDGQLVEVSNAIGATTRFEYDETGSMTRIIDPAGVETVLDYERDRLSSTRRGDVETTYLHTAAGRINGGTEPGDLSWSATFGDHGALATITDAMGSTVRFDYDELGDIISVVAPDGGLYRHEYDSVGRLIAAVDPSGATVRKGYDVEGRVIELTDPQGGVMRRTLDALGRTVESVAPDGARTRWTYHPNGEIATVTGPDGRTWRTEIDVYGRTVAVVDPTGARATRTYSPAGRLLARTSPGGRSETFDYDAAGRLVATTGIDGVRRSMTLDARGNVTSIDRTDAADRIEFEWDEQRRMAGYRTAVGAGRYEWNTTGRVTRSVDPTGVSTGYEWDERGLLRAATDGAGAVSTYGYDERGRLNRQTTPGGRATAWGYDLAGHVGTVSDPAGVVTQYLRNGSGVVTGLRRQASDGAGAEGWDRTLDAAGREVSRTAVDGSLLGTYDYDVAGRLISAAAPESGAFSAFLWDDADRITTITDASGTSTIERDADGWTVALTSQSGVRTVVERDADGRVVRLRDGDAGDFRLPDDQLVRDPAGRLLIGADGTLYRYDDAGRLAEVVATDGRTTTFEYGADGLVERERRADGTRSFDYDSAGRVAAITIDGVGRTTIAYDAAGRRAAETAPDGAVTTFRWNVLDQLVGIDRIDPTGVRVATDIELDALGRPQRINGELIGYDAAHGLANRIGEVRVIDAGVAYWRSDTADWAVRPPDMADGIEVGRVVVLGARVYDPAARQFLSPDPLMTVPGSNGAASAYTYAWQDPVNFADPTGLRPISQEEYDAIRTAEEQGRLGQAWEAIKEDPWGTVAMVGVVALGVGLMFVPGGQVVGAGILIGAATSAGVGLATGNFNPRQVAIGGAIGGISGGVGAATSSVAVGVVSGGVIGGAGDLANQAVSGEPIDWTNVGISTVVGAATGGLGAKVTSLSSGPRTVANEADRLATRVDEFHSVLDPIAQNSRTTTVMSTREGVDVVASGGRDLSPIQRSLAQEGDVLGKLPTAHAEMTALDAASKHGLTPAQIGVSRPICPACQAGIVESGGEIMPGSMGAVWPN